MTIAVLRYGDRVTNYQVVMTERLTTKILIHVHPDGIVEVEAPEGRELGLVDKA